MIIEVRSFESKLRRTKLDKYNTLWKYCVIFENQIDNPYIIYKTKNGDSAA